MANRMFLSGMVAVGFALLVSQWNGRAGFAVGIAGLLIAILTARYQIGMRRFFALVVFAMFGKAFQPIASFALAATEDDVAHQDDDWITKWIKQAWSLSPPRLLVSGMIVLVSFVISTALSAFDYYQTSAGDAGIFLPLPGAKDSLSGQAFVLTGVLTTVISSLFLSVYSTALRRVMITGAWIGGCMGGLIDLSVGQGGRCTILFVIIFLFTAVTGSLLMMWILLEEDPSR